MSTPEREKLKRALHPVTEEQGATAAVALLLKEDKDGHVLFVKRAVSPGDPWSGQIALPGGKKESADKNLVQTIMREVREEVGIDVGDAEFLGVLPALVSLPRPDMKILPFIILLHGDPPVTINEKEIETAVWISLAELQKTRGVVNFPFGAFPAFVVGDTIIWGLTYRIVEAFFSVLASG